VLALGVASCGGGGASLPAAGASSATAQFTIVVPPAQASPARRRPRFVASSARSVAIAANGRAAVVADLAAAAPGCTSAVDGLHCTVLVAAPVGSVSFAVTLYDQPQGGGNVLARAMQTVQIVAGQTNVVGIVLDGVVASIALALAATPLQGAPRTFPLTVSARDADGNVVIGDPFDAPIVVSDADPTGATKLALNGGAAAGSVTVQSPADAVTIAYGGGPANATISATSAGIAPANAGSIVLRPKTPNTIDWTTFGFDRQRTSANPSESAITTATVGQLKKLWSYALPAPYTNTQPLVATNVVRADGTYGDIVYVGDEHGNLSAVDAATGTRVWSKSLGSAVTNCPDMPDDTYGITSTPAIDRATNRIYAIDGSAALWAFDLGTGAVSAGWPASGLTIYGNPLTNHTWSGLLLGAGGATVYLPSASYCDFGTYYGTFNAIDTASHTITTFQLVPNQAQAYGNGVWSWGGASIDPDSGNLFAGLGNSFPETAQWSDSVIELTPTLTFVADDVPTVFAGGDVDIGATPVAYDDGGRCIAVGRKDGAFFAFDRTNLAGGPTATVNPGGTIVTPVYGAATHELYLAPQGHVTALAIQPGCTLANAWSVPLATSRAAVPALAGGVVYAAAATTLYAYDATSGALLWSSGSSIGGTIVAAPMIANGRVYATSWDGHLTAFGLP